MLNKTLELLFFFFLTNPEDSSYLILVDSSLTKVVEFADLSFLIFTSVFISDKSHLFGL